MSLARTAVRGAAWTAGLGLGSKIVGMAGNLLIARAIAPEVYGEVIAAFVVATLAHTVTRFGLDQYVVVKSQPRDDIPFHATLYWVVLGTVGFAFALMFTDTFSRWLNAPNLDRYMLGAVVAIGLRRVAALPERILIRDMRFRPVALTHAASEVVYAVSAVWLAMRGWGGDAVVIGNIVQACVMLVLLTAAAGLREWLAPVKLRWERTRDMLRFGAPLNVETIAATATRNFDNLMISGLFGPATLGRYNYAYNLADVPATHIGENIGSVLLPSMGKVPQERRPAMLVRSTALLAILLFPMAVGLAVVAHPLIEVAFTDEWQGIAPLLAALSALSVFRPVSWVIVSYFKVVDRTRLLMVLALFQLAALMGFIYALSAWGPVWACLGVGLAYGAHSLALIVSVSRLDGVPPRRFAAGFVGPLAACVPMAAAALGVQHGLAAVGLDIAALKLAAAIAVGAAVYVPAAFAFAPATARDFVGLLRRAFGRGEPAPADASASA